MADDKPGSAGEMSEEEFDGLYDKARLAIHLGRIDEARDLATRMLAARPDSTTAHELMGDVHALRSQLPEAEAEFRRASELEPANADAQRKLGEIVLRRAAPSFDRLMLEADLADRSHRGAHKPDPQAAALRSALFPGLGQVYNGDYERGLGVAVAALVLLGIALTGLNGALPGVLAGIFVKHANEIPQPSSYGWAELLFGGIGYVVLYLYSIWEASRSARESAGAGRLYTPPPPRK